MFDFELWNDIQSTLTEFRSVSLVLKGDLMLLNENPNRPLKEKVAFASANNSFPPPALKA